jgi:hypothetical protein
MSEPRQIVAGGCTNVPRFPHDIRPRPSEKHRADSPRMEQMNEEPLARRIWRALRRMLRRDSSSG